MSYAKLEADRAFARTKMPNAREVSVDETLGFVYEFDCELRTHYVLFAWFAGQKYRVKLVAPEYEKNSPTGHATHLFDDGMLCLDPTSSGCASLADAYGRSVLWANGHSIFLKTGLFPFSLNNLP